MGKIAVMGVEIERKFLVKKADWAVVEKGQGTYYNQGYLLDDPARTIRVRLSAEKAFITIKGVSQGASRAEYEYPIPLQDARELLEQFAITSLSKVRYKIPYEGKLWEVDTFLGENEGLLLAEIELQSETEQFLQPPWLGEEVTDDERYYNSYLAKHPFKSWGKSRLL